jgi:hypothetical protein
MEVLEQKQHRRARQHTAHVLEQPKPADPGLLVQHLRQFGQGVQERTERFGRRDIVTATAPNDLAGSSAGQSRRQRRLTDASLPAEKNEPPASAQRLTEQYLQRRQEIPPLDHHTSHLTAKRMLPDPPSEA